MSEGSVCNIICIVLILLLIRVYSDNNDGFAAEQAKLLAPDGSSNENITEEFSCDMT